MAKKEKRDRAPTGSDGPLLATLVDKLDKEGISRAKIGGFDLDGVLRGKYVSLDKLRSALGSGFGFCDVIFGWDINDALYDNAQVTGWHTGYPDVQAVLDPSTLRRIPWEPGVVAILADFRDGQGEAHPACPRSLLKAQLARAESMGFLPKFSAEFEFFIFRETRDSLYEKNFHGLTPLDPQMMGYSWVRTGQDQELMRDIWDTCRDFGIELEGLHTETGPGVYEAAIRYDDILNAADQAALFKTTLKQVVHRHGLSVTFMAKWNADLPGCGGHIHQSLWKNGKNAFFDPQQPSGMSSVMQHYIGGQMALLRELTAMVSPNINSYKRYVPGLWAPLLPSWGIENRTCALRVIGTKDPRAIRVEHRQGAADINPYVAMAAGLGAGLYGIEHELSLPPETKGDPGTDASQRLPVNLRDANRIFSESRAAREVFGEAFVNHYSRTRDWEVRCAERAVTDWERRRYFELT
ncbi:MAG: glutamine synthetase family protein [Polyangiaceae bacterium]|nr:glutamine synthetase family protein [Polyangiaceae bacterium]